MSQPSKQIDFQLLLASAVHDIKDSLCVLQNAVDDLIDNYPAATPQQQIDYANLEREVSLISNDLVYLLGLYRLQDNHLHADLDEVFVYDLFEEAIAREHQLLDSYGIKAVIECDEELTWFLDRELICAVLNNVIVNASRLSPGLLRFQASQEDGWLHISLLDDGPGYPSPLLSDQLTFDNPIDFTTGSTKLGLYFAAEMAALHCHDERKGYIKLTNPGQGGCFNLYLP